MRILVTNDDGYDAPGLLALWRALRSMDNVKIDVVAPRYAQSGIGHTASDQIKCQRSEVEEIGEVILVDGTPVDCVRAAISLSRQKRPDWVIAGINRGSNLGVDIYTSGTVSAAREAAILGIDALAVSQLVKADMPDDWERATGQAAAVITAILCPEDPPPAGADAVIHRGTIKVMETMPVRDDMDQIYWNINLPRLPADQPVLGVKIAPVSTDPLPHEYRHTVDEAGVEILEYVGRYPERIKSPETDVAENFAGAITISPVNI